MLLRSSLLLSLVAAATASAQAPALTPAPKAQVISIQPIPAVLAVFAAGYERVFSPTVTLGVGGTAWFPDDLSYSSLELKVRYYPQARPLAAFSVGGSLGYTRVTEDAADSGSDDVSVSGPSFGVLLNYGWLLGAQRSFYLGLGIGAKAVFVDDDEFTDDFTARYPTTRISVGYAF